VQVMPFQKINKERFCRLRRQISPLLVMKKKISYNLLRAMKRKPMGS
jgi:hypothetical protein